MIAILRIVALLFCLPYASAVQVGVEQKQKTKIIGDFLGALAPKSTSGKIAAGAALAAGLATLAQYGYDRYIAKPDPTKKVTFMGSGMKVAGKAVTGLGRLVMGGQKKVA